MLGERLDLANNTDPEEVALIVLKAENSFKNDLPFDVHRRADRLTASLKRIPSFGFIWERCISLFQTLR
jgi:hypothetical protein